jgi:ATP-dependent DNA helicase RecQ
VALVSEEDEGLLAALKARRRALADDQGVPAYVIFPDRTLIEMATRRPATLDEMAGITGVGAVKLERFGTDFLAVLTGTAPPAVHPARLRVAGQPEGALIDRLQAAQVALSRGAGGLDKPLNCTTATLAKIAELRPRSLSELERIAGMGPQKAERFGEAFLAILHPAA